ncbi:MAG: PQQ-binding-like beta-propeller repeat protein [Verrucomicrobia bacterium]|nr:PQQ-binding-like beta-propeller repeat protein [Verrucomicrobiota bacterium]
MSHHQARTFIFPQALFPRLVLVVLMAVVVWGYAMAAEPWWPVFHGPNRDNRSRDTGLLKEWPKDGPKLLWKFTDCGRGFACVSIAEGLMFTTGDFDDDLMVMAVDLNGRLKWKAPNGKAWKGAQPGARTTPTYNDGVVYQMNAHGLLSAFTATTGKPLWSLDLKERFEAQSGGWGFTENVIIEGDMLLCAPGGTKGRVVALNKKTGATIWANTDITDRIAYASPIIVTHGGVRQFITLTHETILSVDVRTGKLLWSHKHPSTCDQNVTSPIYHDGAVYVTSGHKAGGRMVKINADGRSVTEAWFGTDQDNCHGGVMLLDGYLYGSGCRLYKKGLVCLEFATGKTMYNAREIGKTSVSYADGRLYCLGNDCSMSLVDVMPERATVVSRFMPPWENKPPCLSHPVICGGRLYIRHLNELFAYDVRAGH